MYFDRKQLIEEIRLRDFIKRTLKNGEIFLFDRVFGPDSRTYHDVKEGVHVRFLLLVVPVVVQKRPSVCLNTFDRKSL